MTEQQPLIQPYTVTAKDAEGNTLYTARVHATSADEACSMVEREEAGRGFIVTRDHYSAEPSATPAQLPNTDTARTAIVDQLRALAASAHAEHPGYIALQTLNGRIGHLGTANGPWAVDVWNPTQDAAEAPFASRTIPASHAASAEGIARYCVGLLAGIAEYCAYSTDAENRAANRTERQTRNRRS